MIRIALDAMSGDKGAEIVVQAALSVAVQYADVQLILVGDETILHGLIKKFTAHGNRLYKKYSKVLAQIVVQHASEVVTMHESPLVALRTKKNSSMRLAIQAVEQGLADACVSAGNTGALMLLAHHILKMVPGIDRPAIMAAIPDIKGQTHVLDLGANVECSAENLYQFALLGSLVVNAVYAVDRPRIALLNIGAENLKGTQTIQTAARLIQADERLNYIGYIEGSDIYQGVADVIVCDGFVGNVALKTSEGLTKFISATIRDEFLRHWYGKLAAILASPILQKVRQKLDPRLKNGASLVGLRGIVIKSHGAADTLAFAHAIAIARLEVQKNVPKLLAENLLKN